MYESTKVCLKSKASVGKSTKVCLNGSRVQSPRWQIMTFFFSFPFSSSFDHTFRMDMTLYRIFSTNNHVCKGYDVRLWNITHIYNFPAGTSITIKGVLDTLYKINLFISSSTKSSIEDFKWNQLPKFAADSEKRFALCSRHFLNSIIFRVSHRLLYCVFIEVDFEK